MTRRDFWGFVAAGAGLVLLTLLGVVVQWIDNLDCFLLVAGVQANIYCAAAWWAWRGPSGGGVVLMIAAVALAMRLPVLCMPPYLSSDVYRYVWDGRVQAAGINPYRYPPAAPALEKLRDPEVFPNINRAATAVTIYPPVAEGIFFLVTRVSDTVTAMKAAMVGFEAVTFLLLLRLLTIDGLPASRVAIYAWHPLPLWEYAGSGHVDAALTALVVAALWAARRHRAVLTGLFLAAASLTKFVPAVLFPALYRRWDRVMPAVFMLVLMLAYAPYLSVGWGVLGFLPQYRVEEGFDAGGTGFYLLGLLRHLPGLKALGPSLYLAFAGALIAALAGRIAFSRAPRASPIAGAALLATVCMVAVSPHYAWYFAWLIVFACFLRWLSLLWLTNACLLLYLVPVGSHIERDGYRLIVESLIYIPFVVLALIDLRRHRRARMQGTKHVAQPA